MCVLLPHQSSQSRQPALHPVSSGEIVSEEDNVLWHQSGVNRDGEPFIQLILNDKVIAQQSIEQAREHARAMLEACEAAEQDAFMVHFLRKNVGLSEVQAVNVLVDFRKWRMRETGKRSGQEVIPSNPDDRGG